MYMLLATGQDRFFLLKGSSAECILFGTTPLCVVFFMKIGRPPRTAASRKYTKEKAPLVGNAFKKFGHELKEIFTSKNNVKVVDVTESTEAEEKTESKEQSINGENTNK